LVARGDLSSLEQSLHISGEVSEAVFRDPEIVVLAVDLFTDPTRALEALRLVLRVERPIHRGLVFAHL
jgi:hypothetical protein